MRVERTLVPALLAAAFAAPAGVDVVRYDLEVLLRGRDLALTATLHARGKPPKQWALDLVPEMKVLAAESDGRAVPSTASGQTLMLDTTGISPDGEGSFAVTIRCEGSPSEVFSKERGGFVRSAVGADAAYVRSHVAWYPRAPDDRALHHVVVVDAPAGWQVRSAGEFDPPTASGERASWSFETKRPIDRVGLAAGPWKVRSSGSCDALVNAEHEKAADELIALTHKVLEYHAKELGPPGGSRFAIVEMPREFGAGSGYSEFGYFLLGPGAFEDGASADWVKRFLAHEAAHQWWGNDGLFTDFANEALAEHAMLRFVAATQGETAAREIRRSAVEKVAAANAAGKTTALADIRGFGAGIDPETYRVHAYEKAMMILAMVEQEIGHEGMSKLLARFLTAARERTVGWKDLRAALAAGGKAAQSVVEQWEKAGIPSLRVEHELEKTGSGHTVSGKLVQSGTAEPFRMEVTVAALCAGKRHETVVKLAGSTQDFSLKVPAEPDSIVIDPDWRLLAARESSGGAEAKQAFENAVKVANSPREADPRILEKAIADLRGALKSDTLSAGEQGAAHTGLGRCLFRLGKLDEAQADLEEALRTGAGGPFHRGWAHLRLGCIADLAGKREIALEHYRAVVDAQGSSQTAVEKAKAFLEKRYRGYKTDG